MKFSLDAFVATKNETISYEEIKEDIIDIGFINFMEK